MSKNDARYHVGQIIHHKLFDYVGVIFDMDPTFQGSDEWYEKVALSRPPRDEPWYHVLIHKAMHTTYVAEQNLKPADSSLKIIHPLIDRFFIGFDGKNYRSSQYFH